MNFKPNEKLLKTIMLERGWGYAEFVGATKISSRTANKLFKGEYVGAKTCGKVARALDKEVTELFIID